MWVESAGRIIWDVGAGPAAIRVLLNDEYWHRFELVRSVAEYLQRTGVSDEFLHRAAEEVVAWIAWIPEDVTLPLQVVLTAVAILDVIGVLFVRRYRVVSTPGFPLEFPHTFTEQVEIEVM